MLSRKRKLELLARGTRRPTRIARILAAAAAGAAPGVLARGRRRAASRILNRRTAGFMGIETKFYDQKLIAGVLTAPTDATGGEFNPSATISLNTVAQGDGESNRDGRQITMRSIQVNGVITCVQQVNQSAADFPTKCFIALVLDTQTNGALLNSEDVFTNPGANAVTAADPFRDLQFAKRFRILAVRKVTLQNPAIANDAATTGNIVQQGLRKDFSMFVNLKGIRTLYSGTTETIANITDNGLNIVAFCTNTQLAPNLSYVSRLRFVG